MSVFNRQRTKPDAIPPEASKSPQSNEPPYDAGPLKEMLGFDRDDPDVNVEFFWYLSRAMRDALRGDSLGDSDKTVTADGNGAEAMAPVPETADEKMARLMPAISAIMEAEVYNEVLKAVRKHAPMHSPHEGYAMILEELDELWDEVKADRGRMGSGRKEAVQVAAMAIRYLLDIDPR